METFSNEEEIEVVNKHRNIWKSIGSSQGLATRWHHPLIVHGVGWLVFILYEMSLVSLVRGADWRRDSVVTGYLLPYSLNIGLFYLHSVVILKISLRRSSPFLLLATLVFIELFAYLALMGLIGFAHGASGTRFFLFYADKIAFIRQLWRGIYFMIFSTAFWLINQSFEKERALKKTEREALLREQENRKLELKLVYTENAFLQAQINPHLLFNTLNFIHSEVQEVSPKASDAILTLSDMMRYSLANGKRDGKVYVQEEVEQIENLILINHLRFGKALNIRFRKKGVFTDVRIVPLLLIPFVENLFKYAVVNDPVTPVDILLEYDYSQLRLHVFNKKTNAVALPSSKIGIKNVRTRLNSHYPNRHSLEITEDGQNFSVNLTVKL